MRLTLALAAAAAGLAPAAWAHEAAAGIITPQMVEILAPSSDSCETKTNKDECRTAAQVAPLLNEAMARYNFTSKNEQAAICALIAFESGNFTYKRNLNPENAGQGTSNMQSVGFNLKYAHSIPELASNELVQKYKEGDEAKMSKEEKNRLLDPLIDDKYNFASGPWFLATQCSDEVRQGLRTNLDKGFEDYMLKCVYIGAMTDRRLDFLAFAKKAFGLDCKRTKQRRR